MLSESYHLLFFGALGMISIYNLGYFIITKSATYASYFSFHVTLFIMMLFFTGVVEESWFDVNIQGIPVGLFFLSFGMLLAFSRDFFELKTISLRFENYFNKLILLNFALLLLFAFLLTNSFIEILSTTVVILESLALILFSAYLGFYKKNVYARFYLFSFLVLFLTLAFTFLSYFNIVSLPQNIDSFFEIAILIEASGLSFALAYQHQETALKLKQNELLFKELSHRVQNNLQQIISILTLQINSSESLEVNAFLEDTINRIGSISLIHKTLQNSSNVGKVNLNIFLNSLTKGYKGVNEKVNFEVVCTKDIEFEVDKLAPLALILNELITNSIKHAFKDVNDAKISIKLEERELMHFTYEDNGSGFVQDKVSNSVGTKLIHILSKTQLRGELFVDADKRYFFSLSFE